MLNLMIVHFFGLLTPGPDFFYVSRMAASNSRRNTVCGIIGITLGVTFWAAAAMFGLTLLFATLPMMQKIIMIIGGSYLIYLGFLLLKSRGDVRFEPLTEQELNQRTTIRKEITKGLLINLSNAKAIIYFSSVMSLVLVNMTQSWQIIVAMLIMIVETFVYFYVIGLLFSRPIAKRIYSEYSRYIDNFAGVVFALFGGYLVYSGVTHLS